jgi:hypothetical protein
MRTWRDVARFHLVVWWAPVVMPWAILACSFIVNLVIFALVPDGHHTVLTGHGLVSVPDADYGYTGGIASIYVMFLVLGVNITGRSFPFALSLGVSRRSYYAGSAALGLALAAADGLALTALQAIERATDGWGVSMHFFSVPYFLSGPWYQTWLTSFAGLALLFMYGMWWGIVYRRWSLAGTVAFAAAQFAVAAAAVLVVAWADAWSGVGHFFTGLTVGGLTALLAVLAAALLAGGRATIRRATV